MSSLTSNSTDAQVWAAYDDNASYEEDGSLAKAKAFVTACLILLRRRPARLSVDGTSTDFESIKDELNQAREFVSMMAATGSVRHLSFNNVRGE